MIYSKDSQNKKDGSVNFFLHKNKTEQMFLFLLYFLEDLWYNVK